MPPPVPVAVKVMLSPEQISVLLAVMVKVRAVRDFTEISSSLDGTSFLVTHFLEDFKTTFTLSPLFKAVVSKVLVVLLVLMPFKNQLY